MSYLFFFKVFSKLSEHLYQQASLTFLNILLVENVLDQSEENILGILCQALKDVDHGAELHIAGLVEHERVFEHDLVVVGHESVGLIVDPFE